jgi:hypothetical protein
LKPTPALVKKSISDRKINHSRERERGLAQFRSIISAAKNWHASSIKAFVEKINRSCGFKAISTSAYFRLEKFGLDNGNERLDEGRLAYIAPYTYCEALKRPYTVKELVAIAQGELDPDQWHNQAAPATSTQNKMQELIRLIREEMGRRQVSEQEFAEILELSDTPEESLQLLQAILGGKRPTFFELAQISQVIPNGDQYGDIDWLARLIGVEPPIDLADQEAYTPHGIGNSG